MDALTYICREYGPNRLHLSGSFRPNSSSAPSSSYYKGKWFTIARVSQGLFSITFVDSVIDLEFFSAHLRLASAAARFAQGGTWTSGTKVQLVRVVDASGNVQDISSDADNVVSFEAVVRVGSDW